ncbi:MAG: hypothetical protein IJW17_02475 [Lentisphaeria bacterium]|nr:hypothetical protein [Lentisphaeria bacterium]
MLIRILTYFVPFAVNILTGGFFFITALRFAQAGASGVMVGGNIAFWGITYCVCSIIISRIARVSNALPLILAGGCLLSVASLGLAFCGLYMQYCWMVVAGIGTALFCAPFQLFAKAISGSAKSSGAVEAAAFYTMTWSFGFATGPLIFARLSGRAGCFVCFAFALAVVIGVLFIAFSLRKKPPAGDAPPPEEENVLAEKGYDKFARLARMGWFIGGCGTIAVCQFRSMWPKLGEELTLSQSHIACVLAVISYTQGLTGLALCRSKTWMFRRMPAIGMYTLGIAALTLLVFGRELWGFYAAGLCFGIYCGCMYFSLVYYSLAHPVRSNFFIAGNETVVGITNMSAPLIGGAVVDYFCTAKAAFVFAALILLIALSVQLWVLTSLKARASESLS